MSSTKLDVIWSPVHHKKFVIWGPDITLYEVVLLQELDKNTTFTEISPTQGAIPIASQSASGVRCLDVSAVAEYNDPLIALGHSSGKVSLTCLKLTQDPLGLIGREFVPRYPRLCNSVAWSHAEPHLLASALDKHRSDHCILLWDVNRAPASHSLETGQTVDGTAGSSSSSPEEPRPLAEMGLSETAHSLSWANSNTNRTLIASMNLKFIKIFDLRDLSNKAVSTVSTRFCYNACADPFNPWQIASRGDNVICVWDSRAFHRPVLSLPQPRALCKLQWCPTRRNLLLSLQKDSSSLRLHEVQPGDRALGLDTPPPRPQSESPIEAGEVVDGAVGAGPGAGAVLEREVGGGGGGGGGAPLASFACHPEHHHYILLLNNTGAVRSVCVSARACVSWGARAGLAWSGGGALRALPPALYHSLGDIDTTMRKRATTDYGLKPDLWQNADLADDESLSALWHFLALSKSLVEDGCIRNSPWKHPGVRTVLRPPGEGYRSEIVPSLLPDLPNRRVTIYRSAERSMSLQLCGWGWGWESAGAGVERAEAEGAAGRAACIAAWHLRLRGALDVLRRGGPQLRVVALALAGLGEERLWREGVPLAAAALPEPYLRALLAFLAAAPKPNDKDPPHQHQPDYDPVLNETGMRLEDRVAFACIYLNDAKLHEYIKKTCDELVEQGDLSGMLLTGASPQGAALLQRWVERSGDVQTAALVAARCFTPDLLRDPKVYNWLDSYRWILEQWQLWWARCSVETWWGRAGGEAAAAGRVGVACAYCGKSVARRGAGRGLGRQGQQMSSCPHCRKPLPRCGVCSLQLGAGGGAGGGASGGASGGAGGLQRWFSWCGMCRHIGHASHLIQWFKEHDECPVSSCNCRCNMLDPPDRLGSLS